jgi:hypothetical protein
VEAHYTAPNGQAGVEAMRYEQGTFGKPWPDTATRILAAYQQTPPTPGYRYHKVQLQDVGAKLVLSSAGH